MGASTCCQDNQARHSPIVELDIRPANLIVYEDFVNRHPHVGAVLADSRIAAHEVVTRRQRLLRDSRQQTLPEGTFIGRMVEGGLRAGYGIMLYKDQQQYYEGEWSQDVKSGNGLMIESDGSYYYGKWENDQPGGSGFYLDKGAGIEYTGQWKQGAKHGHGTESYQDGSVYTGQFCNGVKQGQGSLAYGDHTVYRGQFKDDKIEGLGVFAGKSHKYEGSWLNGKMHGTGKSIWKNEQGQTIACYTGQYREGIKQGFGQYIDSKGTIYKGTWTHGQIDHSKPLVVLKPS